MAQRSAATADTMAMPAPAAWVDGFLVAAFALILLAPSWLWGVGDSHSAGFNSVWAGQFSSQLLSGEPYPRWLQGSYGGLGGPAFYFYPPLAFFAAALVDGVGLGHVSPGLQIGVASTMFMVASGLAMHLWLRGQTSRGWALLGALAYMAAPYHLTDHYVRGAFAEFAAYVFLPLVAWGLQRASRNDPRAWLALPIAYAGLILAHLPTALLASLVLPAYGLYLAMTERPAWPGRGAFLAKAAFMAVLGAGLAAGYWAPALTLTSAVSSQHLWSPYYRPQPWLLMFPGRWPNPGFMNLIAVSAGAALALALGALWAARNADAGQARGEARFWASAALAGLALIVGLVPLFWDIPALAKVQFPWRLMSVIDFAAVSAVALALKGRSARPLGLPGAAGVALACAALAIVGGQAVAAANDAKTGRAAVLAAKARDVSEYLPAGFFAADFNDAPMQAWDDETDARLKWATCVPELQAIGGTATLTHLPRGALLVETDAQVPMRVNLRRFAFPAWQVRDETSGARRRVTAFGPDRLVSFQAAAGHHRYRVATRLTRIERLGWAASGLAAALIVLGYILSARRRPRFTRSAS